MAAPLTGTGGSVPGAYVATPQFENSNPDFAAGGNEGADTTRRPPAAVGAMEPREPTGGGNLANQHEGTENTRSDNVKPVNVDDNKVRGDVGTKHFRDSGYAQNSNRGDTKDESRHGSKFVEAQGEQGHHSRQQSQDPSPAYEDRGGNVLATKDAKGSSRDDGTNDGPSPLAQKEKDEYNDQSRPQPISTVAAASGPRASEKADAHEGQETTSPVDATSVGSTERRQHATGAFARGAGVTGPDAIPDEDVAQQQRGTTAESGIPAQAMKKISKGEKKNGKRLIKIIKGEGSAQKTNLSSHLSELSRLQDIQKQASKEENSALSAANKSTAREHAMHAKYMKAKTRYEEAHAEATVKQEALVEARKRAEDITRQLSEKTREVEELRQKKMTDDREREARIEQLSSIGM